MKTLIIMSGVSGSGKSTFLGHLFEFFDKNGHKLWRRNMIFVSPDQNIPRDETSGKRDYNGITKSNAWGKSWREIGQAILDHTLLVLFDATFTTSISRSPAINIAKGAGYHTIVIHFQIPVELCKERNQRRFDSISEDVIDRQFEGFQEPMLEEGIDTIYRIDEYGKVFSHSGRSHNLDNFFQSL